MGQEKNYVSDNVPAFFDPLPYLCRNKTTSKDHPIFEQVICDRCMVYFCLIIRFLQGCSSPFLKHQAEE